MNRPTYILWFMQREYRTLRWIRVWGALGAWSIDVSGGRNYIYRSAYTTP